MNTIEFRSRVVGPWSLNTYTLVCPETRSSILVDPGAEPDQLVEMLAGTVPVAIIITHSHADHIGELGEMRQRLNVPVMLHRGPHADGVEIHGDRWLEEGDIVEFGSQCLRVLFTPGHTDDQICLALENDNRVLVGDTIFDGGPGKTSSPESFSTTLKTLRRILLWSDDTTCYPGHGPHFRVGDQRAAIEGFLQRDHGAFFGDATWDM